MELVKYKKTENAKFCSVTLLGDLDDGPKKKLQQQEHLDGGWGWMVVFASFGCVFFTEGIVNGFGLVVAEMLNVFDDTHASIASIESLLIAFYFCSGPANGILINRYGCRMVTMAGGVIASIGFCISFLTASKTVLMVFYGIFVGWGFGMVYCGSVVVVGEYFDQKKGLAIGIAMAGSGLGTFAVPPFVQRLLSHYGLRGATLITGGVFLHTIVFGSIMRPNLFSCKVLERKVPVESCPKQFPDAANGKMDEFLATGKKTLAVFMKTSGLELLKKPSMALMVVSSSVSMIGFFVPFVYIIKVAQEKGVDVDLAVFLISIIGVANIFGRVLSGMIADKIPGSSIVLYSLSLLLSGFSLLLFPLMQTMLAMAIISAVFGLFISAYITVTSTILIELLGVQNLSTAFGIVCFFRGIFSMIGPPFAGAIFDVTRNFDISFYISGSLMIIASFFSFAILMIPRKKSGDV